MNWLKRTTKFAFGAMYALSLLLLLAASILWIRGFCASDTFSMRRSTLHGNDAVVRMLDLTSDCRQLALLYRYRTEKTRAAPDQQRQTARWDFGHSALLPRSFTFTLWQRNAAFMYQNFNAPATPQWSVRIAAAPWWFVLLMLAVLPGIQGMRLHRAHRQRQRAKNGLCVNCGYDLRASPDRCPECGTAITEKAGR